MILRPLLFSALAAPAIVMSVKAEELDDFLRQNAAKFPLIRMERGEEPFAKVHTLPPPDEAVRYKDRYYSAYRFRTPDWLDGSVLWMFSDKGAAAEAMKDFRWYILSEEDDGSEFRLSRSRWAGDHRFPYFQKYFPGNEAFYLQTFDEKDLKKGKNYIVWFSFTQEERPTISFALTVRSNRGLRDLGILPTGPSSTGPRSAPKLAEAGTPKPPHQSAKEASEIFKKSGADQAFEFLDKEATAYLKNDVSFYDFFFAVWKEAQTGSGRHDQAWAAALYRWLQEKCLSMNAVTLAEELCCNTAAAAMNVNRYGAARQAMQPFLTGMERRQLPLDPSELKDAGPGLPFLPEVRQRRIPKRANRSIWSILPDGWVYASSLIPDSFDGNLIVLSDLDAQAGEWKKALERHLWVCDWLESVRGEDRFEVEAGWFKSRRHLAGTLHTLGLLEAADAEWATIQEKDWPDVYRDRSRIDARYQRIAIRIDLGYREEPMLAQLDELRGTFQKNPYFVRQEWENVEITKAKCLNGLGRFDESDEILSRLVTQGNSKALTERVVLRLEAGKLDGLEAELVKVLASLRESGRKIEEARVYSIYADLLEKLGRLDESIAIRREAIRLSRAFDLFVVLPQELAKLSVTLVRCGESAGAKLAADEATEISSKASRVPERVTDKVRSILEKSPAPLAAKPPEKTLIDLQPVRAMVVPIDGKPVRGRLTLANPSSVAVEGTLGFDGLPVNVSWNEPAGEARVTLGQSAGPDRVQKLRVDPGSFVQILLSADEAAQPEGELTVWWSSPGQDDRKSLWTFETAEKGVSSAVIDAGEFKRNAFYGVPIHHHYQHHSGSHATLRAVASVPARVELYDANDKPVYVDANGNGDLTDTGDSIFADGNTDGIPDLPLEEGEAVLRLQVFPAEELPKEGMTITVEALTEGKWLPFSEDKITP